MATRASNAIFPDMTTGAGANLKAMAQFIEDTLVTSGGWVVTADTGQTLPSALAAPSATNQKMGYRIYRMADALQATAPVFLRIDFGSNWNSLQCPGLWFTFGTGSNGAGTITGIVYNGGALQANVGAQSTSSSAANTCYGSADTNRFTISLFTCSTTGFMLVFGVSRTKDSTGNDTAEGLLFLIGGGSELGGNTNYIAHYYYFILAGGTQPAGEAGLNYVVTFQNPSQSFGGDIGVGPLIPIKGVAQQPGKNWLIVNSNDFGSESSFTMSLYNAMTTYKQLNIIPIRPALVGGTVNFDNNARLCMRYD
jgi:hypothetical protein